MRLFLIISSILLCLNAAHAQPVKGASYIGLCSANFPCARALEVGPQAIGYLSDAFNNQCLCLKEALKLDSLQYVRVHISNGTCFPERGRRCEKYDVFYKETQKSAASKIMSRDRSIYRRFRASLRRSMEVLENSGKEVRYSPMMESPFPTAVRRRLLKEVEGIVGKERVVDSVLTQPCIAGYICERHGDRPKYINGQRCISDLDGITLFDADLESLKKSSGQCETIFYWTTGFNLLPYKYTGKFIPPGKRKGNLPDWELNGLKECLKH